MKTLGQHIIDEVIKGNLFTAVCAESDQHNCIIVWSSGAAEQLEAIVEQFVWFSSPQDPTKFG
jgi:hypothetical protein